ncbi:MAG: PEP-CTERM sorting domain-containing protein [Planctomycetota bacterium]|jgi:hypothetical protein
MARKAIILLIAVLIVTKANADIVEYDLNCDRSYTPGSTWTADFDLGVIFSDISHIYLDWSGSITANEFEPIVPGMIIDQYWYGRFKVQLRDFGSTGALAQKTITGGPGTAPDPEPFDLHSEFNMGNYSAFLDGLGSIKITFDQKYPLLWYSDIPIIRKVSNASGQLDPATLIVDGTVVPEPATLILLTLGTLFLRQKK